MIRKGKAGNLVVKVRRIIRILEARTEVEDPVVFPIAACQELANGMPVITIKGFDAVGR